MGADIIDPVRRNEIITVDVNRNAPFWYKLVYVRYDGMKQSAKIRRQIGRASCRERV